MKLEITAHPNSKNPRVEKDLFGRLHVYVNEPPLEGRANRAVTDALAKHFKIKKYQINLVSGAKSKQKIFDVKK